MQHLYESYSFVALLIADLLGHEPPGRKKAVILPRVSRETTPLKRNKLQR